MAFDPDEYLAAKSAPPAASGGGFDPDSYLKSRRGNKPFPWEMEAAAPEEDRIGRANRAAAETPTPAVGPTSVVGNLKLAAGNLARGAKTLGTTAYEEAKSLPGSFASVLSGGEKTDYLSTHPEARRELERGLSDTITFGLAEKAARAVGERIGDPSFAAETAQSDAQVAPGSRTAGGIAGAFVPSPASFIASKAGKLVPGTGAVPGALRAGVQYEATAPLAAAINAEPGKRLEAAADAATDPTGLILSGGIGAATGAISRAPERVRERGTEAVARGEAGGTANKKIARKATGMAGEEGENLYAQIGDDTRLEAAQSILAKSNPGTVAKMYTRRLDRLAQETEPFYEAIDNAPDPRFANASKAPKNGGVDLGLVEKRLEASRQRALDGGHAVTADAYDKALSRLRAQYGKDGVITPGEKLASRSMRNYANTLGENLLPDSMDPQSRTLAQAAKRSIYRDVVGAIEDEGTRVGLDMSELKRLNRKIATFAATRDALADRAVRAQQGHTTSGNLLQSVVLPAAGFAASGGGVSGLVAGAGLEAARRLAMPTARAADFALAKLVQASRAGAAPAQLGRMALELGVSQQVAGRIAKGGLSVLNEEEEPQPTESP